MLQVSGFTKKGRKRSHNEDAFLINGHRVSRSESHVFETDIKDRASPLLIAVADGLGGHAGGEIASGIAVETLSAVFIQDGTSFDVRAASIEAHRKICRSGDRQRDLHGMGSTIAGVFIQENEATIFNVGDSRAYHLHDENIKQLSVDDVTSFGGKLTQCLGTELTPDPVPHVLQVDLRPGDGFILVSDGISDVLSNSDFLELWVSAGAGNVAEGIGNQAASYNSTDDTTAVVLRHYP